MKFFEKPGFFKVEIPDRWLISDRPDKTGFYLSSKIHTGLEIWPSRVDRDPNDFDSLMISFLRDRDVPYQSKGIQPASVGDAKGTHYRLVEQMREGMWLHEAWILSRRGVLLHLYFGDWFPCQEGEEDDLRRIIESLRLSP